MAALKTREVGKTGIEAELRRVAKAAGWFAPKFTSPANRSVPDRICMKGLNGGIEYLTLMLGPLSEHAAELIVRGVVASVIEFAECKAPGKKPTKKQAMMHEYLYELGFNTRIIDTKDAVREYVRGD